jgi:hypothetical protein
LWHTRAEILPRAMEADERIRHCALCARHGAGEDEDRAERREV